MKLLEMGKDMKIKHSLSSYPRYGGLFSLINKAFHEKQNFGGK